MKPKTELVIKSLCLLIVISLCLAVYIYGKSLTCDQCIIDFKQTKRLGVPVNKIISVNINNLYLNWTEGYCIIEWANTNGFIDKSKRIIEYAKLH